MLVYKEPARVSDPIMPLGTVLHALYEKAHIAGPGLAIIERARQAGHRQ